MTQFIGSLIRLVWFVVITLLGLFMAAIFICSTLIAILIMLITGRLRGGPSGVKEYFKRAQSKRKPLFDTGALRQGSKRAEPKDIIDVQAKEIK